MLYVIGALAAQGLMLPTAPAPMAPALASARAMPRVAFAPLMQEEEEPAVPAPVAVATPPAPASAAAWGIKDVSPDGSLIQRVEGMTRKTWAFKDTSKDRVQVALTSEGRPVHTDIQLWLGPNYTPFTLKAYSEDGKLRPIQTLVGTRNKQTTVEVRNIGEYEFPFSAASNYATPAMAAIPTDIPATVKGELVDGGALRSYPLDPSCEKLEVVINTKGRQLKARIELLNAPNNPKQTYEIYTSSGELNSLVVCFETPDAGNTVRVVNLSPVEFPAEVFLREVM